MKAVIILFYMAMNCLMVVSSLPTWMESSTSAITRAIILSAENERTNAMSKRHLHRRLSNSLVLAFNHVDSNHNTHVTADEFAGYYATRFPIIGFTQSQWMNAFLQSLPIGDSNHNLQLEVSEFADLAVLGGYNP